MLKWTMGFILVCLFIALPASASLVSANPVEDERINQTVRKRLDRNAFIDPSEIIVTTQDGNVTLAGHARNDLEKDLAERMALEVGGVKSVANRLSTFQKQQSP